MSQKVRVLIVDDSAFVRKIIENMVETSEELEVCGKAGNGELGLAKINILNPDVVITDIEMPKMNGLEFLKKRRELGIKIPFIVLSSYTGEGAKVTMEALSLGACDFIQKPVSGSAKLEEIRDLLIPLLEKYGKSYQATKGENSSKAIKTSSTSTEFSPKKESYFIPSKKGVLEKSSNERETLRLPSERIKIVAIGASTGGPLALKTLLAKIPKDFPCPIVIVQHMPKGFTEEFANSLNRISPLKVKEAQDGEDLIPGKVLVAPGGKHLKVEKKDQRFIVTISDDFPKNSHRPSVGVLFESVASSYGASSIGIIMTGMGNDGSCEIGDIHKRNGITIGQSERTCVVYGMPKVAYQNGFLDYILDLDDIPSKVIDLVDFSHRRFSL